jgi:hypothetical protein
MLLALSNIPGKAKQVSIAHWLTAQHASKRLVAYFCQSVILKRTGGESVKINCEPRTTEQPKVATSALSHWMWLAFGKLAALLADR